MRRLICILLLMCLPLQSFAMHGASLLLGGGASMSHVVDHDQQIQHHHDVDGSTHYDTSDASAQHIQDHSCSPQPAYLPAPKLPIVPDQLVSVAKLEFARFIPEPFLDGPHRPPAPTLGQAAEGRLHT